MIKKVAPARRQTTKPQATAYDLQTRLIHGASKTAKWDYAHHVVPPITSSAAFRLDSSRRGAQGFSDFACDSASGDHPIYIYDRLDEPTRGMLEENLAAAEGGEMAVSFATGMAAITAAMGTLVQQGGEIIAHQLLYGCAYSLLTNWMPRQGVNVGFVNLRDPQALAKAVTSKTRIVYFETPINPTMELIDIGAIRRLVDRVNRSRSEEEKIWIVVDNTFATPLCQRPLGLGADVVVASLTKGIGGFGTDMGGVVVGPRLLHSRLLLYRKDFGGVLSPKAAWNILVYGLPSLAARMARMQDSALLVARFLEKHPRVARVVYPGLASFPDPALARRQMRAHDGSFTPGSMIYFTLKDSGKRGRTVQRFIDRIANNAYCITLAVSLGQVKTLIESPHSMTHSAYEAAANGSTALDPGGIRLSVGLEEADDIVRDLSSALQSAQR